MTSFSGTEGGPGTPTFDNCYAKGGYVGEPEAVFGQMKFDMAYRRFRHFGKDKVKMDFAFFAIAFNLKKNDCKNEIWRIKA